MKELLWPGEGKALRKLAGEGNLIIEIGSFEGGSATWLANENKNLVIAVDPFKNSPEYNDLTNGLNMEVTRNRFVDNIRDTSIAWLYCPSSLAYGFLKRAFIRADGLFIDGWHTGDALKIDIHMMELVKAKGWVAFHDYANREHPQVRDFVDKMLLEMGYEGHIGHIGSMLVMWV